MQYSICLSTNPAKFDAVPFKGNFEENVKKIASIGFDGIELAIRDPKIIDKSVILSVLEKNKMSVPAIGTGQAWGEEGLSYTDPDFDIRKRAIERTISHIDFASETGAVIIIGLLRGILQPGIEIEVANKWMCEAFKKCCDEAAKKNVRIAFEPINRFETSFLNSVRDGLEFIKKVGADNLGMLLDTFHMNIEEPIIEESIMVAGQKMYHFHYADSNRMYPGCGHIDFKSILRAVKNINYKGFISGEHTSHPEPSVAAERGLEFLKKIEKEI